MHSRSQVCVGITAVRRGLQLRVQLSEAQNVGQLQRPTQGHVL